MRRYCIVSGILLILPIIDFAVAAPVLVQEKRQAGFDVAQIPEDAAITMLGKRGDDLDDPFLVYEDYFAKPEESSAARPSSSSPPSEPDHGWTDVRQPLSSILEEPSTMSDADHELVEAHALPNPGQSTESGHESTEVHAPLSSSVFPTWFHPDHADYGLMDAHAASRPNSGPSNPRPSTEFDSDHTRLAVEEPPSRPASPTEIDADQEYEVVHPPFDAVRE
jgi:hypothetical protein